MSDGRGSVLKTTVLYTPIDLLALVRGLPERVFPIGGIGVGMMSTSAPRLVIAIRAFHGVKCKRR